MLSHKCKNCTFYSAYYKKWADGFTRLDKGFCCKHQKAQTQYEYCEEYKCNERKEKSREERLMRSLELSLKSINEIAEILKEKFVD